MEHTLTPCKILDGYYTLCYDKRVKIVPDDYDKDSPYVMVCGGNNEANAEFIVKACNSHDMLVNALKEAQSLLYHSGYEMTEDKCIMPKTFFGDAMTVLEKINNALEQVNI